MLDQHFVRRRVTPVGVVPNDRARWDWPAWRARRHVERPAIPIDGTVDANLKHDQIWAEQSTMDSEAGLHVPALRNSHVAPSAVNLNMHW